MKKVLTVLLLLALLTGCGSAAPADGEKLQIVTTIFPQYDWVREILGDRVGEAELTLLQDSGVDLHSYQPTADDIIRISTCDMFIYVGGESDGCDQPAGHAGRQRQGRGSCGRHGGRGRGRRERRLR